MKSITLPNVSAVSVGGRALLLMGPSGSGKSTLALELIDRGATLIGDDGVVLRNDEKTCIACPPPKICGKLEIRGVGIVDLDTTEAPLALIVELNEKSPRFVENFYPTELIGCAIPTITLPPDAQSLALRSEWAMRIHGLLLTRE